jgi:hypothetical protein
MVEEPVEEEAVHLIQEEARAGYSPKDTHPSDLLPPARPYPLKCPPLPK